MALNKVVRIMVWARAAASAGSFTFDLLTSPYWTGTQQPTGIGGHVVNWFADESPAGPAPVAVTVVDGALSATLSGTVVTCQVDRNKPAGQLYHIVLDLDFA